MNVKESCKVFRISILMASLLLCLGCLSCVSPRRIANRVLEAPNQHIKIPEKFQQLGLALATNFPVRRVAVGPPPATLDLMVMEPGDYGVKMDSTFTLHQPQGSKTQPRCDFHFVFDRSHFSATPKTGTDANRGTIFLLHGYGLDKESMVPWGLVLAKAGYRVVLVDLRGNGHSTGDQIFFGGIERTDMVQCLDTLMQRHVCEGPVGALGISYGAVVALQWAAIDPRVQSVAAISPYLNPRVAVDRYLKTFAPTLTRRMDRKAARAAASRLAAEFPDLDTETAVRRIKHPILFVRGEYDEVCFKEDLNRFQAAAPPGSEVKEVPNANHLFTGMSISQLRNPVTKWFRSQLTEE